MLSIFINEIALEIAGHVVFDGGIELDVNDAGSSVSAIFGIAVGINILEEE